MKSKIERSELDVLEDILQEVQENNELMQELLADGEPQSQPEEKTLEQIREEFDKERIKEWNKTAVETYKQATQDTPVESFQKSLYGKSRADYLGEAYEKLETLKSQDTPEELFTTEELRYLGEVMQLDYSLAVTFGQREKSDIGGGLLRKLDKLNSKKK